jgi:hypothetical protein
MRTFHALLAALPAALTLGTAAFAADFEVGQIWSAKGRAKDPDPKLIILKIERVPAIGEVVFIALAGVQICLPSGQCGDVFTPLAMSKRALDQSVKEQIGQSDQLPDFEKGYQFWKDGVAKGAPVTITVPLAEALDQIEGGAKIQVK